MRYMLDTNICIYLMKHKPQQVVERFVKLNHGDVVMSVITLAELQCGVSERTTDYSRVATVLERLQTFVPVLPFEVTACHAYAELFKVLPDRRRRDALDRLIASHAIATDCILVTNNETDFKDYPNLQWENWVNSID